VILGDTVDEVDRLTISSAVVLQFAQLSRNCMMQRNRPKVLLHCRALHAGLEEGDRGAGCWPHQGDARQQNSLGGRIQPGDQQRADTGRRRLRLSDCNFTADRNYPHRRNTW